MVTGRKKWLLIGEKVTFKLQISFFRKVDVQIVLVDLKYILYSEIDFLQSLKTQLLHAFTCKKSEIVIPKQFQSLI